MEKEVILEKFKTRESYELYLMERFGLEGSHLQSAVDQVFGVNKKEILKLKKKYDENIKKSEISSSVD